MSGTPPPSGLIGENSSGASSTLNLDLPSEGILVPEPEIEVETMDTDQATVMGRIDDPAADEDAKRHLREQLRRTLSHRTPDTPDSGRSPSRIRMYSANEA